MIQIFSAKIGLQVISFIAILCFGAISWWLEPQNPVEVVRSISIAIGTTVTICATLTHNFFWRFLWKVFPIFSQKICPDLNGIWQVTMQSNIAEIAKFHPDLKDITPKTEIFGQIRIVHSFYRVIVLFDGRDGYSKSRTVCANLQKDRATEQILLSYIYENSTPTPLKSDEQKHFGAATLELKMIDGETVLDGVYWTNRNWQSGLNTAGHVVIKKT